MSKVVGLQTPDFAPGNFSRIHNENADNLVFYRAANPARFDLIAPHESIPALWQALLAEFTPLGFATLETLRIMQALPAAGHEIIDEFNPHEIGLYPFINFEKGCYVGQEVIARLDSYDKVQRQLIGMKSETDASLLKGATIWRQEQEIGRLTSVAPASSGTGAIGLAVVRKSFAQAHVPVTLKRENESFPANLVHLHFRE